MTFLYFIYLFMVYLMMTSVTQTVQCHMIRVIVNDKRDLEVSGHGLI
jgi:hypothetical protein